MQLAHSLLIAHSLMIVVSLAAADEAAGGQPLRMLSLEPELFEAAAKRCCLTAFRQPSDCRFRSISRPGAFGKARAQCCMQTQGADTPSTVARAFSAHR